MRRWAVLCADGTRARFLTLEPPSLPTESGPKLVEHEVLLDPDLRLPDRELFSESEPGGNRAPPQGPSHGYDDHRDRHRREIERAFAREVMKEAKRLFGEKKGEVLVVAAEPKLLGLLRDAWKEGDAFEVVEVPKDYTRMNPRQIQDSLAQEGILPAQKRPEIPL